MKFPNAAKGVKKLFRAQIIALLATIAGIATVLTAAVGQVPTENEEQFERLLKQGDPALIGMLVAGGCALVFFFYSALINILGYLRTARDEDGFKKAVILTVISIALNALSSFLQPRGGFIGWLGTASSVFSQIMELLATIAAIVGLMDLSEKCGRPDMVNRGASVMRLLEGTYILSFIFVIVTQMFRQNAFNDFIADALALSATFLAAVRYVLYFIYLGKASKMLKET